MWREERDVMSLIISLHVPSFCTQRPKNEDNGAKTQQSSVTFTFSLYILVLCAMASRFLHAELLIDITVGTVGLSVWFTVV
jgi:hypothetical protein